MTDTDITRPTHPQGAEPELERFDLYVDAPKFRHYRARATCPYCGWRSRLYRNQGQALRAFDKHLRELEDR